jgi:hypothetical protein
MKQRILVSLASLLLLLLAYGLGYWSGARHSWRGAQVIVARETSDITSFFGPSVAGFDDYFTKNNPIPDKPR